MSNLICVGSICNLFVSENKRNVAVEITKHLLKAFGAANSDNRVRKFLFLNFGRFDPILPDNVGVYGFIAPFYFEGSQPNHTTLYSKSILAFCELYGFQVYFDGAQPSSDYDKVLDKEAYAQLQKRSNLPLGE